MPKINKRAFIIAATTIVLSQSLILAKTAFALVTINEAQSGELLFKSKEPGKFIEAPTVATDYTTTISGPTARTIVTQQFYNPSDAWVEGVYVFPLPDNSAVDTLKLVTGTRVIIGDIKEKQEAKVIYEKAKEDGQAASLLEQQRPNLFTNSIANIGPHEKILIQIEFQETLRQTAGTYHLRLPLVAAPRYEPAPLVQKIEFNNGLAQKQTITQAPVINPSVHGTVNPVTISIDMQAGFALGAITSATHKIKIAQENPQTAHIELSENNFADRDFELNWQAKGDAPQAGLFKERINNHDYVLGYLTPPQVMAKGPSLPRDITFVIDNSGSMDGASMPQAKESLIYGLAQLKPEDQFNIIRFDDTMSNVFGHAIPASQENITRAKVYVESLTANGGTEMLAPMIEALRDDMPNDKAHLRQVVFITDGEISNEQDLFNAIASKLGRSRVFMVGIGTAPNSYLMTRASELGRGTFTHISEPTQVLPRMQELFTKIGNPVITNLKATSTQGFAITPQQLPDLYAGEPVQFYAEGNVLEGDVSITGKIGDQPWQVNLPLNKATTGKGIAKLLARRKIAEAEVAASLGSITPESADKTILQVALEHHLVSNQTSLIAVDKSPKRPKGYKLTRADVPVNLPAGWVWDKVFGEAEVKDAPQQVLLANDEYIQLAPASNALAIAYTVPLAAGGTQSTLLGLLALLLSLCGLTLVRKKA